MSDTLALIQEAGLLPLESVITLSALTPELERTWRTAQMFRTRTEMAVSVLNDVKHPTPDSKYWQAVREQDVFVNELTALSFEYRKNEVEQRKLTRQMAECTDDLEREALQVEAERLAWVAAQMRRVAAHRMREIMEWSRIKAELEPLLRYGIEDVDAHQLQAFQKRFNAEASLVTEHTPLADARNVFGLALTAQRRAARLEES